MTLGPDGHGFVVKAGSIPDVMAAGTPALHEAPDIAARKALFDVSEAVEGENTKVFDASLTADMLAEQGITDAVYTWTFADGQTAEGVQVAHGFTQAGHHDVSLMVSLPDGMQLAAGSIVDIRGGQLISFDADQGAFTAFGFGRENDLGPMAAVEGGALQLGGSGTVATVTREAFDGLRGSDMVDLTFTLEGGGTGEVFRLHGSFITSVDEAGDLAVLLFNDDGDRIHLETEGIKINDGTAHQVSVSVQDGSATLRVGDQTFEPVAFEGTFATSGFWDLAFGNPWGKDNFEGSLTQFDVSVGTHLDSLSPKPSPEAAPSTQVIDSEPFVEAEITGTVEPATVDATYDDVPVDDEIEQNAPNQYGNAQTFTFENYSVLADRATAITLGGEKKFHEIGHLREFEASGKLGVSVDFTVDEDNGSNARLIWNHLKLGLTIQDDEIMVQIATAEDGFKAFKTEGLGVSPDQEHNATVLVDGETDHFQLIFDGEVVLEVDDTDFELVGAGGHEWGWSVGTAWNRPFTGEVSGLKITDEFEFEQTAAPVDWTDDIA